MTARRRGCRRHLRPAALRGAVLLPLLLLLLAPVPGSADAAAGSAPGGGSAPAGAHLRVAAVQLSVHLEMLRSLETYSAHMEAALEAALACRPDLVVFPEYTGVFLSLIPYYRELAGASTVEEGLERVRRREPLVGSLRDLFLLNSGWTERALEAVFATAARKSGAVILAGSFFAWAEGESGPRLTNRAVVFGADGSRIYYQDKVYLTPFEEDLLGLSPGSLSVVEPFPVSRGRVGVTICRDSFFSEWEAQLAGSDLWVDIKANGTAYTQEEQERFQRALPARIRSGDVPFGLTVCLTGSLFDLVWEGQSSLVRKQLSAGGGIPEVVTLRKATSAREQEILLLSVPLDPAR
ncbi:MAG: hypothetical protein JW820_08025 [Spirochaetales bacterium]|nr:hypothetical protein [Spirochaetales bacterium]